MTEDPKKRFRKAVQDIDLNLGNLFGTLGQALNEAVNRLDQTGSGQSDESLESTKGPIRAQAGIRVRIGGLDAAASAKPQPVNPDRARPTPGRPRPAEPVARELSYDLFEDGTVWILTAEMPGATVEDLTLEIEDNALLLQTKGDRPYQARIPLPVTCAAAQIKTALHNGILTLQFPKDLA
jgi:HSP20 family molecular chaperone IbpA